MKQSKDGKVEFHEDTHSYILDGKRLTSVTQYISKFKQPFDTERIAGAYARKHALTKEYVIQMWKDKGEKGQKSKKRTLAGQRTGILRDSIG